MLLCISLPNVIQSGHLRHSNDVILILNMAAAAAQYYFRFWTCQDFFYHAADHIQIWQIIV